MGNQIPPISGFILLANILIFLVQYMLKLDLADYFGMHHLDSEFFQPYQLITYMFIHGGLGHLFGNMLAVFIFGSALERLWGPQRFLFFYLATGIGAAGLYLLVNQYEFSLMAADIAAYANAPGPDAFSQLVNTHFGVFYSQLWEFISAYSENPESSTYASQSIKELEAMYTIMLNIPMVGASGAVFAVLVGFAMIYPNVTLMLLIPPMPVKAKYLVGAYLAYEIYALWQNAPNDNIAHLAHLGGAIFGFILLKIWKTKRIQ